MSWTPTPFVALSLLLGLALPCPAQGFSKLMEGMEFPAFSAADLRGQTIELDQVRGSEATVVLFWATWSRNSLPALDRLKRYEEPLASHRLGVVAINVEAQNPTEEDRRRIDEVDAGLPFPVALDSGLRLFHQYGVVAVPSAALLDGEGRIAHLLIGYPLVGSDVFFRHLEQLLGMAAAPEEAAPPAYYPPKEAVRLFHLAEKLLLRQRTDVALEKLAEARAFAPEFLPPYRLTAEILADRGDVAEAAAVTTDCLGLHPDDPHCLRLDADFRLRLGDKERARRELNHCIEHNPAYSACYSLLGLLDIGEGKIEQGVKQLARAVELNPLDAAIQQAQGEGHLQAGDATGAAAAFRRAVEIRTGFRD